MYNNKNKVPLTLAWQQHREVEEHIVGVKYLPTIEHQ